MTTQTVGFTQKQRVLMSLERAGARGITRVDWIGGNSHTPDCGAPIINLPARINELKAEGHRITASGQRDSCKVYVLAPHLAHVAEDEGGQLFTISDSRPSLNLDAIPAIYQEAA